MINFAQRNFGLDLIRAVAILLVLVGHFDLVLETHFSYAFFKMGFFGVELFFVLSGFLIGKILIDLASNGLNIKSVFDFWVRRWLRTIPLYYLVLIIRMIFLSNEVPFLHFFFLQNSKIIEGYDSSWFGESWSLTIEEFFYLTIPLVLLVIGGIFKNKKTSIFISLFLVISICLFFRTISVLYNFNIEFEDDIRKFTFFRLDSISMGVLFAFLKCHFKSIYLGFQHKLLFISVLVLFILFNLAGNILVYDFIGEKLISSTIGLTLNSFLLAALIPFLEKLKWRKIRSKFFGKVLMNILLHTSLYSYCIYLIHIPIYEAISTSFGLGITMLQLAFAWVGFYTVGYLSYNYFELPILKWRNKITSIVK
jgi:peptidoglycan/LPS O-acetylase OafA/YrhL